MDVTATMQPLTDVTSLARALIAAVPQGAVPQGAVPQGAVPPRAVPPRAVPQGAPAGEPATVPVVLDVRWRLGGPPGAASYREGHLPGAVFVDLDTELCGSPGPAGRHPLPSAASFQAVMRRAGVRAGRPVVVYDDGDGASAARAWWTLRYFGHQAVQVLDGGYLAWVEAGQASERGDGPPAGGGPGDFTAVPGGMATLDAGEAARLARYGVLLDARAAARYRGEVEPVDPVAGHIPGAVSAPASAIVAVDGRLLSPAELRARFAALGVTSGRPVGTYCGSGVTAAHEVLALALAGLPAALYVGSWSEWVTDPTRPVAVGEAAG